MRALLDLIYPPRCAGCDLPGTLLCERCAAEVARIDPASACPWCGAPARLSGGVAAGASAGAVRCAECAGRAFAFSAARCTALLAPPVSSAVVVLKDGGERRYAAVLAGLLAETVADGWLSPSDILVPVPASPAAVRRRGFDHVLDVTRALGAATGNPVVPALAANPVADQRTLGRQGRFANRADAFRLARPEVPCGRLVLVDDVLTTGATFDAAARTLAGADAEVRVLAVARSCSRMPAA